MKILGFQKLTLLDYPGKVACTVFTGGCNFRCPFCHNASLVLDQGENEEYGEEEIFGYLEKRRSVLDGVCITGGEPLLAPGLIDFINKVKALGYRVKLDTNGFLYERLADVINLSPPDYIAMDIKNSPAKYAVTAGVPGLDTEKIAASVSLIMNSGIDYEFRTTVVKELHEASDFEAIAAMTAGCKRFFIQSFKDSGDILSNGMTAPDIALLTDIVETMRKNGIPTELRGVDG